MSQPITSLEAFTHAHMEAKQRIEDYLWLGRSNFKTLNRDVDWQLKHEAARLLFANNPYARVALAKCVVRSMKEISAAVTKESPAFFVTLIPNEFAVELNEEASFDVCPLKRWAKRALRGLRCLGMVEAALYTNLRKNAGTWTPTVSWHVHLIVWGTSYSSLNQRLAAIRERHNSLVEGIDAAHSMRLTDGSKVEEKLYYMLKSPLKEYRIAKRRPKAGYDRETGEFLECNGFQQWKRDLRTGHLVQMCNVMQDQHLDRLLFGIGEGEEIHRRIRREMLRDYRRLISGPKGHIYRRD